MEISEIEQILNQLTLSETAVSEIAVTQKEICQHCCNQWKNYNVVYLQYLNQKMAICPKCFQKYILKQGLKDEYHYNSYNHRSETNRVQMMLAKFLNGLQFQYENKNFVWVETIPVLSFDSENRIFQILPIDGHWEKAKTACTFCSHEDYRGARHLCGQFDRVCRRHRSSFYKHFVHEQVNLHKRFVKYLEKTDLPADIQEKIRLYNPDEWSKLFRAIILEKSFRSLFDQTVSRLFIDFLKYPNVDLSEAVGQYSLSKGCNQMICPCHFARDRCAWVKERSSGKRGRVPQHKRRQECFDPVSETYRFCDQHYQEQLVKIKDDEDDYW